MSPIWHLAATLAVPALRWNLRLRLRRGKEEAGRLPEREGHGAARPEGRLLWLHAASVGETLAILPLLSALAARDPALNLLVTTGTVTSAKLLPQRLSPELAARIIHRYLPLDVPAWVARFLDSWRPDAVGFVESELWPNLLGACAVRGIPMALLNARISARSFRRWRNFGPRLIRRLLAGFALIAPRSAEDAARLTALGAPRLMPAGDLKLAAEPLPADPADLAELRAAVGTRPVLLAAATHPGEEVAILAAAGELAPRFPDLLTIIAPRHPERGAEVAALAQGAPRRGEGALPGPGPAYIADTIGELGLFYRVASLAVIGGSLIRHGGQNPLEAARLGCPVILGPHMENFSDATAALLAEGGAVQLPDAAALAAVVADMLSHPERATGLVAGATRVVSAASDLPGRLADALLGLLSGEAAG